MGLEVEVRDTVGDSVGVRLPDTLGVSETDRVGVSVEVPLGEREGEREGEIVALPLMLGDADPLCVKLPRDVGEVDKEAVVDKIPVVLPQRVGDALGHSDEVVLVLGVPVALNTEERDTEGEGEALMQAVFEKWGEEEALPLFE